MTRHPRQRPTGRNVLARTALATAILATTMLPAGLWAQAAAAERLFREAERLHAGGDPAAALSELRILVQQFSNDRLAPPALLRIAQLERGRGEREEARATLERLVREHARSVQAASALNLQAQLVLDSAVSDRDLSEAQNYFRRVVLLFGREAYPDLEPRRLARIRSGEIALMTGDPASAAAEIVAALEDESPGADRHRARLELGRAWIAAGDWQAGAAVLEQAVADADADAEAGGEARAAARRLLSLLERRVLRRLTGQKPWLTSGRFPASGPELREPSGVAAAPDGRVLVHDGKLPLLLLLSAGGEEIARRTLEGVERPGWLGGGWLDDGQRGTPLPFLVGDDNVVLPFDGTSYAFNDPQKNTPLKNLVAAAPGTFGDWFLAAKGSKSVLHVPAGSPGRELLEAERPNIADLARDPRGNVYALDARTPRVLRLQRDGTTGGVVASGDWKRAAAVDVDELGYVYVLDRGNRRVDLFAPDASLVGQVGPVLGGGIELRNPVDLAVDGSGRLFIADTKIPFVVMLE